MVSYSFRTSFNIECPVSDCLKSLSWYHPHLLLCLGFCTDMHSEVKVNKETTAVYCFSFLHPFEVLPCLIFVVVFFSLFFLHYHELTISIILGIRLTKR